MSAFHSFWSSDHTLFTVYLISPFSELQRLVNQFWWDTDPHFLESSRSLISACEELLERPHKHSPTLSAANCQTNLISLKDDGGLSSILYCSEIREWNSAGSGQQLMEENAALQSLIQELQKPQAAKEDEPLQETPRPPEPPGFSSSLGTPRAPRCQGVPKPRESQDLQTWETSAFQDPQKSLEPLASPGCLEPPATQDPQAPPIIYKLSGAWRSWKPSEAKEPQKLPMAQEDHAAAKSLQSCSTLRDPIDGSPQGSPVPGIFQARTLEWVAISFSNAWKWKVKVKLLGRVRLLATPWTAAYQAPPSRVLEWGAIAFSAGGP